MATWPIPGQTATSHGLFSFISSAIDRSPGSAPSSLHDKYRDRNLPPAHSSGGSAQRNPPKGWRVALADPPDEGRLIRVIRYHLVADDAAAPDAADREFVVCKCRTVEVLVA